MSEAAGNVLVVYGLFAHPLRSTVEDHLLAFARYSGRRVFHLNARVQEVPRHILRRRRQQKPRSPQPTGQRASLPPFVQSLETF